MAQLEWNDDYSVGIDLIDAQHRGLMNLLNELNAYQEDEPESRDFEQIIDDLINYVSEHFATEEAFFEETAYPQMDQHIIEHQFFVEKVNDIASDYYSMDVKDIRQMIEFLSNWYSKHIMKTDRKYIAHLREHLKH